jgi:hypothetical protein
MTQRLQKLITRGENILGGSFGLVEGYQEFNALKFDIIQWLDDLKSSFGRELQSPECLPEVLKSLRELLPREDFEDE